MSSKQQTINTWNDLPKSVILKVAKLIDGWTIYSPERFIKLGVPATLLTNHITVVKSNPAGGPKQVIYINNKPVKESTGIYGLRMLQSICSTLKIKYEGKSGRGFQARACEEAIQKWARKAKK